MNRAILLVNFGGPRSTLEIEPFLTELLTDRELIRTKLPAFLHNALFRRIARKRTEKIRIDYELIGGKSPIYETTESMAALLKDEGEILTFHRYLPSTHKKFFEQIEQCQANEIIVFPLFPQFSYATTGSIASLLAQKLSCRTIRKLRWIKSYPAHPAFIRSWQTVIRAYLEKEKVDEKDAVLFFSAHGIPRSFVCRGDPYEYECEQTYRAILRAFPSAFGKLAYQSKFGKGEWLRPYTNEECERILEWSQGRKTVVFVPMAFTSDHIETLYEIEQLYLPPVAAQGLRALRCPALNLEPHWINSIREILQETNLSATQMLMRNPGVAWCCKKA